MFAKAIVQHLAKNPSRRLSSLFYETSAHPPPVVWIFSLSRLPPAGFDSINRNASPNRDDDPDSDDRLVPGFSDSYAANGSHLHRDAGDESWHW